MSNKETYETRIEIARLKRTVAILRQQLRRYQGPTQVRDVDYTSEDSSTGPPVRIFDPQKWTKY